MNGGKKLLAAAVEPELHALFHKKAKERGTTASVLLRRAALRTLADAELKSVDADEDNEGRVTR